MRLCRNEKGIALVTALLLTLIALTIVVTAIYMATQGTRISGINKRYQTALEASYGGVEMFAKDIIPKTILEGGPNLATFLAGYSGTVVQVKGMTNDACFNDKLLLSTAYWSNCTTTSLLDPKTSYDLKLELQGAFSQSDFNVYAKIVETLPGPISGSGEAGNTNRSAVVLLTEQVVSSGGGGGGGSGVITPEHFPYMYRIEVQAERVNNPDERANLSVLYAY